MKAEKRTVTLDRFATFCDSLPTPAILINLEGQIIKVNKAATEFVEGTNETLEGKNLQKLNTILTEQRYKHVKEAIMKHLQGEKGIPFTLQATLKEKDVCFELHGKHIKTTGEDGTVEAIFIVARNVTEQVAAAKELQEYRRRLEGAIQAGNVAWWEMDVETWKHCF